MIFIFAADLRDAQQWCQFQGVRRADSIYVGQEHTLQGRRLQVTDRVHRTARHLEHPASFVLSAAWERALLRCELTENLHGALVRQS